MFMSNECLRSQPLDSKLIAEQVINGQPINSYSITGSIYRLARELHRWPHERKLSTLSSKRIALVIPYHPLYEVGGLEIGTRKIAKGLANLGHQVEIISKGQYEDKDLSGEMLTPEGITVHGIGHGVEQIIPYLMKSHDGFDIVQWMEIFPPIPEEPDIYNDKAEQQYLASVVLRSSGVETFLYVATSHNVRYRGTNNKNWSMTRVHQPFNALLSCAITGFNVINPDLISEYYEAGIRIPKERFECIPLGVDTNHFTPVDKQRQQEIRIELGLPLDKKIIFYVGRFVERKRPDLLIKLWEDLPEEVRNKGGLVFIGGKAGDSQPDSIYPKVMDLIHKHNAERKLAGKDCDIFYFDLVPFDEMPKYVQAGDAIFFPSEREGLGMVLLESMACGKPVFTSDIPGIREAIPSSKIGVRFNPNDEDEIKGWMIKFLNSPDDFSAVAQEARNYVVQSWSWYSITQKLDKFYNRF